MLKKSEVYVYIAGKYSADTTIDIEQNIIDAKRIAIVLAQKQIQFFCPHTHSALFDSYVSAPWEYYMHMYTMAMTKLCNCVIMIKNWPNSQGAKEEYAIAKNLGFPIFHNIDEFIKWYDQLDP